MSRARDVDIFWKAQKIWSRTKDIPHTPTITTSPTVEHKQTPSTGRDEDFGEKILKLLATRGSFDSYELAQELGKDHQQVVGAIKSLQSLGDVSLLYVV